VEHLRRRESHVGRIEEYTGFERVSALACFIVEHGEIGAALLDYYSGDLDEAQQLSPTATWGNMPDLADYVQELTEETTPIPPTAALLHLLSGNGP